MANNVYKLLNVRSYKKAGPQDVVEVAASKGSNNLYIRKWVLEALGHGIVNAAFIHLSGPTGTAKSSVIEALYRVPDNFPALCRALGFPEKPIELYPIEMVTYETPGELYHRRALKDGTTYDEESNLVQSLRKGETVIEQAYPLIWLREMGRVHSASVQGGLLNLMTKGDILLPDNTRLSGRRIAWIADSNYQAEQDSSHTLVTFDDALKRRFPLNITLDYLPADLEITVLEHILKQENHPVDSERIAQVVRLGQEIRRMKAEGQLQSVIPPTIYGYLAFLDMARTLPHFTNQQLAGATLLGNVSMEDQSLCSSVLNQVFGFQFAEEEQMSIEGNLF